MSLKIALIVCLTIYIRPTVAGPGSAVRNTSTCDALLLETDGCIRRMLVTIVRNNLPRTTAELTGGVCKQFDKEGTCLQTYGRRCLRLLPKTLFNIGFKQVRKQFRKICNSPAEQKELLETVKCLEEDFTGLVYHYLDLITKYMDHVASNVTVDEIIPHICCGYFTTVEDIREKIKGACDEEAGLKTADFLVEIASAVSADLIELACGRYASVQSCKANLPQAINAFQQLEKSSSAKQEPKNYSILVPIVQIVKRLDHDI